MTARPAASRVYSRRELLGGLARWSVPTVVSISLGARALEAKASCPPCQKLAGGVCRACAVGQILNCQCEPCLGPPYCSAVGPTPPAPASGALTQPFPNRGTGGTGPVPGAPVPAAPYAVPRTPASPLSRPMFDDPFGFDRRVYGQPSPAAQGLYQRLRPDSLPTRRLP